MWPPKLHRRSRIAIPPLLAFVGMLVDWFVILPHVGVQYMKQTGSMLAYQS